MISHKQHNLIRSIEQSLGVYFQGMTKADANKFINTYMEKYTAAQHQQELDWVAHMYQTGRWEAGPNGYTGKE